MNQTQLDGFKEWWDTLCETYQKTGHEIPGTRERTLAEAAYRQGCWDTSVVRIRTRKGNPASLRAGTAKKKPT